MLKYLSFFLLAVLLVACGGQAARPEATEPAAETTQVVPASPTPEPAEVTHIRLPMGYIADPQYAPFYVALDKGYFRAEGFEVEFDYSFETDGVALVGAGELPFAIVSGEQVILGRAQKLPIVYVLEWFQRFPIAVISRQAANITTPQDLVGRRVGLPGFFGASYIGYAGLLTANQISQEQVNAEEIGFTQVETLLSGQVDAVVGYANNEPLQLQSRGEAINVLYVADYIDMVANGVITNEETIANNPHKVQAFVRALLKGLAETLADPAEAYEISKKYVEGLDNSRLNVLEASLTLWQTDTLGATDPAAWENTQEVLLSMGFLDAPLEDLSAAYTNQFVTAANQ